MKKPIFTGIALATLAFAGTAIAGARENLDAFTRGLSGADAQFSQTVFDASGKRREAASGKLALSSPRLFRWEYTRPYPQLIVADGKTVWVYDPDLEQVTRRAQGAAEQNSPLAALVEPARLDRDYNVSEAGSSNGMEWLEMTPKGDVEQAGFRNARLGFTGNSLSRMVIVDAVGQRTEIDFSNWRRNPGLPASTFRFTPPAGVDVVGD
ncbi:MAG: outer membrane lipoprotein chaperone LolA [Pseudoxanthomonas suwonensis]|nr:outer membrane lipoprotein chaperone LolA [Pseudoxanthomonas suwonensis]